MILSQFHPLPKLTALFPKVYLLTKLTSPVTEAEFSPKLAIGNDSEPVLSTPKIHTLYPKHFVSQII
jgi:hypothetical protein